ncbi:MAG: 2-amino-4-hydroxy-6-hydroxymethyldihydropteridine diphosphokinase [Bacteroidales bacterium]|jgi:2-amino-4-hydroxy-6-hydroxymethyldihydropteridine diphosphokinase|nr:2-amino-4-hydroxy-6-hydroxymethyldihydropteridine diphosphokinase [Bacteroidales bacterium]
MNTVFLSIGTNIGQREENIAAAIMEIEAGAGHVRAMSGVYETEPWEMNTAASFLNMAVKIETLLSPHSLLETLLDIETRMGRMRHGQGYFPRIIDIDILFFDNQIINDKHLTVPHPLISYRRFVLEPLACIAPLFIHPVIGKPVKSLLESCTDKHAVRKTGITL